VEAITVPDFTFQEAWNIGRSAGVPYWLLEGWGEAGSLIGCRSGADKSRHQFTDGNDSGPCMTSRLKLTASSPNFRPTDRPAR